MPAIPPPLSGNDLRWPAEWEPQEAVWLSWPHRRDLWQGGLDHMVDDFARLAALISEEAEVRINAEASLHGAIRTNLAARGVSRFRLFDHPADDVWCRDHGPIFTIRRDGLLQIADWRFNAWGGKFAPWDRDDAIPERIAGALQMPRLASPAILEGGSIEGNGAGLVLTTESVQLNPNRNPDLTKADVEAELHRLLGTRQVFWLGGGIEGDDTDGHIDDMVRFVREDAVVAIEETDRNAPHYRRIAENNERLQDLRTVSGSRAEVVFLPMPQPILTEEWRLEQLPASYANFLIVNKTVIVPIFMQERTDDLALGILRECFPGKRVVGFDARRLVVEGGAVHCVTQQQPAPGPFQPRPDTHA